MKRNSLLVTGVIVLLLGLSLGGTASALLQPDDIPGLDVTELHAKAPSNLTAEAVSSSEIQLNWIDNSTNEERFFIERKKEGDPGFGTIASVGPNINSYKDKGLAANTKYYYRVKANNNYGSSEPSNTASATTKLYFSYDPASPLNPGSGDLLQKPAAPSSLTATALSSSEIQLNWVDNSSNEKGFFIHRKKEEAGGFTTIASAGPNVTSFKDTGLTANTKYYYIVAATNDFGSSDSNETSATTKILLSSDIPFQPIDPDILDALQKPDTPPDSPPADDKTVLKFYIDNDQYLINETISFMDTAPIIKESRTLLPIRYVATPLGAVVGWDPIEQKVSITLDDNTIHLWINKNTALVNGVQTAIDPLNPNVTPIIVPPGRTMLPLRFIAENLDCKVEWDQVTREAKVTYPK